MDNLDLKEKRMLQTMIGQIKHSKDISEANKSHIMKFEMKNDTANLSINSRVSYLSFLKHLGVFAGKIDFKELNGTDLQEFIRALKNREIKTQVAGYYCFGKYTYISKKRKPEISPNTLNGYIIKLKTFFKWLYKCSRHQNPEPVVESGLRVINIPFKLTSEDLPTEKEVMQMINVMRNPLHRALIAILYDTGMRLGDCLRLKVEDVINTENEVRIRFFIKKNNKPLLYSLGSSVPHIMSWLNIHPFRDNPDAPLFSSTCTSYAGQISKATAFNIVKRASELAGIKKRIYPHIFRHAATYRDKRLGFQDEELRILRGWSRNSNMPLRYGSFSVEDVMKKRQVLEGRRVSIKQKVSDEKRCPKCQNTVFSDSCYCQVCGQLLSSQKNEMKEILLNTPSIMQQIINQVQENVEKKLSFQKLAEERFLAMNKC